MKQYKNKHDGFLYKVDHLCLAIMNRSEYVSTDLHRIGEDGNRVGKNIFIAADGNAPEFWDFYEELPAETKEEPQSQKDDNQEHDNISKEMQEALNKISEIKINLKEIPFCNRHHKRLINDWVGCEDCQEEFRKNPKLGKFEEKPKSIWKSAEELPDYPSDIILTTNTKKNHYILCHFTPSDDIYREHIQVVAGGGEFEIPIDMVHKYCKLTDFINHIESLEERIKKLEEK